MNQVKNDPKLFAGFEKAPAGFLDQVIRHIDASPTLQKEVLRFQAKGGVIEYNPSVSAAQTIDGRRIRIPYPREAIGRGEQLPSPFSGKLSSVSPIDWFVGNLAHEMGHALDPNFVNIENTPARAAQNIATSLLSEGKAEYNRIQVSKEIFNATQGSKFLPIVAGPDSNTARQLALEATSGRVSPSRAIADLAEAMATAHSANTVESYVQRYGRAYTGNSQPLFNYGDVVGAHVRVDAAGSATCFTLVHSNGSQTMIELPDYGPLGQVSGTGSNPPPAVTPRVLTVA